MSTGNGVCSVCGEDLEETTEAGLVCPIEQMEKNGDIPKDEHTHTRKAEVDALVNGLVQKVDVYQEMDHCHYCLNMLSRVSGELVCANPNCDADEVDITYQQHVDSEHCECDPSEWCPHTFG